MVAGGGVGIVGGGIVGTTVACFLCELGYRDRVVVYEPDPTYEQTSTFRSAAAIRQQFNLAVNVAMSRFGAEFFAGLEDRLQRNGRSISFSNVPYLMLAATGGFDRLRQAHARQVQVGADVELLERQELEARFPWLEVSDLAGATLGRSGEGWFDPRAALSALRERAISAGASYVPVRIVGMGTGGGRITSVVMEDGREDRHEWVVDAAGRHAAQVAQMAGVHLPIQSKKRTAFVFSSRVQVPQVVQVVDPTVADRGLYLRPFGTGFMAVTSPAPDEDPEDFGFEPQRELFDDIVRPALARRVPGFAEVELRDMWAGHYEMNTFDQNAIIGTHDEVANLVLVCGFSGHGVMHAPAAARGIAELITSGAYGTLDLSPFSTERVNQGRRLDDVQPSERPSTAAGL